MSDRLYRPPGWSDADLAALATNPMHRPAGWPPADDPIPVMMPDGDGGWRRSVWPAAAPDPDPGLTSEQPFPHPAGPGWRPYRPGERGARFPLAGDVIDQARENAAAAAAAAEAGTEPDLTGRTWLEAATAIPEPAWFAKPRQPYVRVYRTAGDPEDPEIGPCWHWRCEACRMQGNGCAHAVLHGNDWRAVMCGGFHHVHTEHPRRPAVQGEHPHDTLGSRRRCDWSPPDPAHLRLATLVLCGRTGYPRGDRARAMAREVLALAGRRTP